MPGHVPDHHAEPVTQHRQIVKIIPAGGLGGMGDAGDVKAGNLRRRFRKQPLLDLPGDVKLRFVFAQLLLGPFALDHAAELGGNGGNKFPLSLILLTRLQQEKLDHRHDLVVRQHGNADAGFDAHLAGGGHARKIRFSSGVANPDRLL